VDATIDYAWSAPYTGDVVLRVTDDDGETDTDTAAVTVAEIGQTDVTADVTITAGRPGYDPVTGHLRVTRFIANSSTRTIFAPLHLVLRDFSTPGVDVVNADGVDGDGNPYVDLSGLLGDGEFAPGESVTVFIVLDPNGGPQFTFEHTVLGVVPGGGAGGVGGTEEPIYEESFDDGIADDLVVSLGSWTISDGRLVVTPTVKADGLATFDLGDLPDTLAFDATVNADPAAGGRFCNVFLAFDVQDSRNFKAAGLSVGIDEMWLREITNGSWGKIVKADVPLSAGVDYELRLEFDGPTATFTLDGSTTISHTFPDALNDGALGLVTRNARSVYDDIRVVRPATVADPGDGFSALPYAEDFEDGVPDAFVPTLGSWSASGGWYHTTPDVGNDALALLDLGDLPGTVQLDAIVRAEAGGGGFYSNAFLAFDVVDERNFRVAGLATGMGDMWIGRVVDGVWIRDVARSVGVRPGEEYHLRLELDGSDVSLTLNGAETISTSYGDSLTDGPLGLVTHNSRARFDDVQVQ
jgi:hypothetical protein